MSRAAGSGEYGLLPAGGEYMDGLALEQAAELARGGVPEGNRGYEAASLPVASGYDMPELVKGGNGYESATAAVGAAVYDAPELVKGGNGYESATAAVAASAYDVPELVD